jgi:hypothetical protein
LLEIQYVLIIHKLLLNHPPNCRPLQQPRRANIQSLHRIKHLNLGVRRRRKSARYARAIDQVAYSSKRLNGRLDDLLGDFRSISPFF